MSKTQRITTVIGKNKLEYEPCTGYFYWLDCYKKPWRNGERAEHVTPNGYLYIKANQKQHSASRLAYKLYFKDCPSDLEIDHINRNKVDNRPQNLRLVTRKQQLMNRRFRPNKCGVTGVSLHKQSGLYRARYKNKTTYHKTIEEAKAGYAHLAAESCEKDPT